MTPHGAQKILRRRLAYLRANAARPGPGRPEPHSGMLAEIEALRTVLGFVNPDSKAEPTSPEEMQWAYRSVARRAERCTCERCPVHPRANGYWPTKVPT